MLPVASSFRSLHGCCARTRIARRAVLCAFGIGGIILATARSRTAAARIGSDRTVPIFVIAGGWHTELGLPVESLRGSLALFADALPGVRYLVFGWGQRDYYMAREPAIGDLFGAALPSSAVMLVVPLWQAPANAYGADHVFNVVVSDQGASTLSGFIWRFVAMGADGRPVRVAPGPYPQSAFYASNGTYSLGYTCNTWTATALKAAGVPIHASDVVLPGQLTTQLQTMGRLDETAPPAR